MHRPGREVTCATSDGRPIWIPSCTARLQPESVSKFFVLQVETNSRDRRTALPADAEENIARLPYLIGGYDLDTHVSKLQLIFRSFSTQDSELHLGVAKILHLGFEARRV
jgi:hypothetical protein